MLIKTIDSFFNNFDHVLHVARSLQYKTEVYPADNTEYPGIAKDIPDPLKRAVCRKICTQTYMPVDPVLTFFRLSVPGPRAPHYVHTDLMTARYTLLVYMTEEPGAGTGFYRHKRTGMNKHPTEPDLIQAWVDDQRDLSLWEETNFVPMKANRAVIFDAAAMHCALPTTGFGKDISDGRLVFTMFWNPVL